MAVQVSGSGTTLAQDRGRYPMRFASGIPVVAYSGNSTGALVLVKGNSINPTSFSTSLLSVSDVPYDLGNNTWVMISPTLAMCGDHFYSGMTQQVRQWTVNEAGTNNGGAVITTLDDFVNFTDRIFDTAVDSNGALHVIYTDMTTNMGTAYLTLYYINNVGGSWNSRVEVFGAGSTTSYNTNYIPCIQIDSVDFPIISYSRPTVSNTARGNTNNATSFTNTANYTGANQHLWIDERGNYFVFYGVGTGLRTLAYTNVANWSQQSGAWSTPNINSLTISRFYGVKCIGEHAYLIYKDLANNISGITITKLNIVDPTAVSIVATLHRTSDSWLSSSGWGDTMKATPLYHNYDKNGVDVGVSDLAKEIDLAMNLSDGAGAYDPYWESFQIAPTIALNTADLTDFTDTTPTLEQTGDEIFDLDTLEYDVQVMTDNLAVVDSYSEINQTQIVNMNNTIKGEGQSFTGDGKYLTRATFYLSKTLSPQGIIRARLYAHSGTFGTSSVPTGSPLAISTTALDVSTLTTSLALIDFDFDGNFQLVNGTNYVITVEYDRGDSSIFVNVGYDGSPAHSGSSCQLTTVWAAFNSRDLIFYINGHTLLLDRKSDVDTSEFVNTVTGGDTHPFNDAEKIAFTVNGKTIDKQTIAITANGFNATFNAIGQSFQGQNVDLYSASFKIRKINSPTGNVYAKLYAHSGTYGTSSIPTGTELATSNAVDVTTLSIGFNEWTLFTFPTPYTLSSGTNYVIVLEFTNADATNYITYQYNAADVHSGNRSTRTSGTWTASSGTDLGFVLNEDATLSVGTYYWRARARNEDLTGYWSAIRSFDITVISSNVSKIKVTAWKDWVGGQINIGGTWKTVTAVKINIGGVWKDADITP